MKRIIIGEVKEQKYGNKEALNSLRSNLQFSGAGLKTFLFTSSLAGEGKSTVAFDVAKSMAESGKNVVLVDADMRKSVMLSRHKISRTKKENEENRTGGLSQYLAGMMSIDDIVYGTNIKGLYIVMSGPLTPNPTELISGQLMDKLIEHLKQTFDAVIIDSPPLGSVIDAAMIAPKCDGTVLVIEAGKTKQRIAQDVKKQLDMSGCKIIGIVLNKVKVEKKKYYKYYGEYY